MFLILLQIFKRKLSKFTQIIQINFSNIKIIKYSKSTTRFKVRRSSGANFIEHVAPYADCSNPTSHLYAAKIFSKVGRRAWMVQRGVQICLWNWLQGIRVRVYYGLKVTKILQHSLCMVPFKNQKTWKFYHFLKQLNKSSLDINSSLYKVETLLKLIKMAVTCLTSLLIFCN